MSKLQLGSYVIGEGVYNRASGPVEIRLTNDYLFKALLQKNKDVLKSLICSLLHFSPSQIENVFVTNPMILGERADDKAIVLDVNVVFNNRGRINLEMQVINRHNWPERSTYYACRNFNDLNKAEDYSTIKPAYQIGFLDFTLFPKNPCFYARYKLADIKSHHILTDKLSIGIVDLTNISLATAEDKRYNIDKWASLFKAQTWEEIKMIAAQDINIKEAAETIYQLSEDERIRQECEAREDYIKCQNDMNRLINKQKQVLAEQKQELAEQEQTLAEQEQTLAEQKQELAEQEQALAEKDRIIETLQKEIEQLKALNSKKGQDL